MPRRDERHPFRRDSIVPSADGDLLVFTAAWAPHAVLWDLPLPVDLDDPRQRSEVDGACRAWGVPLGAVRKALARGPRSVPHPEPSAGDYEGEEPPPPPAIRAAPDRPGADGDPSPVPAVG